MAQLDRLLNHLASRNGKSLRLDPNQQPMLESFDGLSMPLLPSAVPSSLLEHLASEIMTPQAASEINNRGETRFEYKLGDAVFQIFISRSGLGPLIRAEVKSRLAPPEPVKIELQSSSPTPPSKTQKISEADILPDLAIPLQLDSSPIPDLDAIQPVFMPTGPSEVQQTQPLAMPTPPPGAGQTAPPSVPAQPKAARPAPLPLAQVTPPIPPMTPNPTATPASLPPPALVPPAFDGEKNGCHPLAEKLFSTLIKLKGSDLHLTSFEVPLARIDGDLVELDGFTPLGPKQLLEMMASIATAPAWQHFKERNDADFAYPFEAGGCRLRVNFFMDRVGPGLVCRVIPNQLPDPDKLGLPDHIRRLADLAKGLVLVTGPTGSGKSTTLAAIIDLANKQRNDHILTIEDPIEFVHPRKKCLVNQREVGTHTESFKSGLRAALREDPDIVLVGEMRDLETISIALETAITGHLVFGTLHTNSAVGTIDRIVDQFPADRQQQIRVMLSDALKASISQTLLKKLGGGRVAALESLFVTPAIANLIREGKTFQIPSAMQTGRAYGQRLMNDCLVELIQKKTIEPMEAYLKCADKESFMSALKRANINWDPRGDEKPMPL